MDEVEATEEEEANARQLAELEFIQSAYTSKEAWVVVATENEGRSSCRSVVRLLHLPVDDSNLTSSNAAAARSTSSSQPISSGAVVTIELNLTMPSTYPIRSHLVITGTVRTAPPNPTYIRKAAWDALPVLVQFCQTEAIEFANMHDGGEAVWHVLNCAEEWIHITQQWYDILRGCQQSTFNNNVVQQIKSDTVAATATTTTATDRTSIQILGRRSIYSHHIISSTKRKDIVQLATNYNLGGYVKIGWPGIIIIEGKESYCQLFVNEIKSWRWQYLSVRYEEQDEEQYWCGDDDDSSHSLLHQSQQQRKLPIDFIELGDKEDSMSKLAQYCRDAGLEHMFLACLKLSPTNEKKSSSTTTMVRKDGVEHDTTTTTATNVTTTTMTTTMMNNNCKAPSYGVLVQVDHMNDRKRYHRSLKNICDSSKCLFFIRHCLTTMTTMTTAASAATMAAGIKNPRHATIFVGVIGDKDGVKNVLKQWRTSRVDVNSKNKPCLERMMTVLMEGVVVGLNDNYDDVLHGSGLDCSLDELKELVTTIYGNDWVKAINHI
jgi:hypothetical protein